MSMKSSTPVVESLTYRGATSGAYSVTNGSTTSIYVKKSEAYDNLGVLEFLKDSYNGFTVTWKDEFVSSLPSGYKTATQVFSPGTANTAQVLTGYTFSSANGTNLSGAMPNRGNLNWSGSNTTYSVPAGYYSGGTLDSRTSYNNGYNSGYSAGVSAKTTRYTVGEWTLTRAGFLTLGYQPNVFLLIDGTDLQGTPMGIYSNIGGLGINAMEGPSNTHLNGIFYVNGSGIGLQDRSLSYANNRYTRYIAARIV